MVSVLVDGVVEAAPILYRMILVGLAGLGIKTIAENVNNADQKAGEKLKNGSATDACSTCQPPGEPPDDEQKPPGDDSKMPARVTPKTRKHILDGDDTGGGHRAGTGESGKSEFPSDWSDDEIIQNIEDVANDPTIPEQQSGPSIVKTGVRDGVEIKTVIDHSTGIIKTGYPTNVPRNP